jgi:hypothetical protein
MTNFVSVNVASVLYMFATYEADIVDASAIDDADFPFRHGDRWNVC